VTSLVLGQENTVQSPSKKHLKEVSGAVKQIITIALDMKR